MKTLHYNIYNNSNCGMANIIMSIENALIIAKLTSREEIIFYGNNKIFNSEKGLNIFDLYDVKFPFKLSESNDINQEITSLGADFHSTVIYYKEKPSAHFIDGRQNIVDLSNFENLEEIRTHNNNTLSWYSHLFYLGSKRTEIVNFIKDNLTPKEQYKNTANQFVTSIKEHYPAGFYSMHLRRGDYLYTDNTKNSEVTCEMLLPVLNHHFTDKTKLLVIHSDEKDSSFFDVLSPFFHNNWIIGKDITGGDSCENGLVSLLIASYSDDFIGTFFSTFTGLIQRYRIYNGRREFFKYLFSQRDNYQLVNGMFKEEISHSENTWGRLKLPADLKQINFWTREWPECFSQKNEKINQFIVTFPEFITEEECDYLIKLADVNRTEYFSHENRSRVTPHIDSDPVIRELVKRACSVLKYDYECIEPSLQLFRQETHGQTFSHVDSIYEDRQGKRISSVLFYLNDDFEGSYIDFAYIGLRLKPMRGMMVCYPLLNEYNEQDIKWTHSASLITKGTKVMAYFSLKERP